MRNDRWEIFSAIRVRPPLIVRADGRGFKKLLESFDKPYDIIFARSIVGAARRLMEASGLSPDLAFVFSDEVNILFLDVPFNGRLEKLDSVVSGYISAALSLSMERLVSMDSRSIPLCPGEILEYLSACQDETWLNHVFSYGFYSLIDGGMSRKEAMKFLRGMKERDIHEMLFQRGVNLAKTPAWERRGVLLYRSEEGAVLEDWEPPLFRSEEGQRLLEEIFARRSKS